MGCGKACFGRRGQIPPKIENFGLKVCSLGPQKRSAHETSRQPAMRPRGNPHRPRGRVAEVFQPCSKRTNGHKNVRKRRLLACSSSAPPPPGASQS